MAYCKELFKLLPQLRSFQLWLESAGIVCLSVREDGRHWRLSLFDPPGPDVSLVRPDFSPGVSEPGVYVLDPGVLPLEVLDRLQRHLAIWLVWVNVRRPDVRDEFTLWYERIQIIIAQTTPTPSNTTTPRPTESAQNEQESVTSDAPRELLIAESDPKVTIMSQRATAVF
jgi:hypothetical protein